MEDLDKLPKDQLHLLARLGEMLLEWNTAEDWLQGLLLNEMGRSDKMQVLTTHMSNVAVTDALRTLAADFSTPEMAPHLTHAAELFDRLREYRNFYAHASIVQWPDTKGARIYLHQATARGRFSLSQTFVRGQEIEELIEQCMALSRYASAITGWYPMRGDPDYSQSLSSLEKPPLPDRLQKPRLFPQAPKPPPHSSQA